VDYTEFMNFNQAFVILKNASDAHDAKIILEHFPKMGRIRLWRIARQLRRGVPVAKIIHEKWFYGLKFYTDKNTLDPRPDSETLVDAALGADGDRVLDIGTGTGCLVCAIVKNKKDASGVGIDISWRARCIAQKNVQSLNMGARIKIIYGDFNKPMNMGKFDIIVSNPPYIARGDTRVNRGALNDPKIALYAGADGLDAYRAIAKNAYNLLNSDGRIFLEIGLGQMRAVRKIFADKNWKFVKFYRDLGGVIRVLEFSLK
jgi:release factor glutamine methyltransferase